MVSCVLVRSWGELMGFVVLMVVMGIVVMGLRVVMLACVHSVLTLPFQVELLRRRMAVASLRLLVAHLVRGRLVWLGRPAVFPIRNDG